MKTYRGIVTIRATETVLNAGGVTVRLDGDPAALAPFDGMLTDITGEQRGDVIYQAAPANPIKSANASDPFAPVVAAIQAHLPKLTVIPGVVGVRPGFGSEQPHTPVVVVVTDPAQSPAAGELPAQVDGIPVDTRTATAQEMLRGFLPLSAWGNSPLDVAEAVTLPPPIKYVPPDPAEVALTEMLVRNITCHVGPDAGWPLLKPFLEGTTQSLTVAMYEFYATHIVDTVTKLGQQTTDTLNMILQVSTNDAQMQATLAQNWGVRLNFAKASVSGPNRIFNNSYHTKVAVRDSRAFWLSSGNWSPNSQPVITPADGPLIYQKGNREWHVIIDDGPLAQMYEKFIRYDMRKAGEAGMAMAATAPFLPDLLIPESVVSLEAAVMQPHPFAPKTFAVTGPPVRVKPLMSPDNYAPEILKLIQQAQHTLYLQFAYIRQPSFGTFDAIISAITRKMAAGLDVRILVSTSQEAEHSDLLIAQRGWKREQFRQQTSKLHNKGILIDGNIAVVGSNNWSTDGTQFNRDTSLVFFSRPIAQYYTDVFLFDWTNLSQPIGTGTGGITPMIAPQTGPTPLGMIRIPWQAWFAD